MNLLHNLQELCFCLLFETDEYLRRLLLLSCQYFIFMNSNLVFIFVRVTIWSCDIQ